MISKNPSRLLEAICFLILACYLSPAAADKRFGSWEVSSITADDGIYAATVNESKAVLGQYCLYDMEQCFWVLVNDINCNEGSQVPVLVNTDGEALNQMLLCMKIDGKPGYAFTDFNAIEAVVRASSKVGIAFPLQSGLFQVNRFSLTGAIRAITFMRSKAEDAITKRNKGTKDRML